MNQLTLGPGIRLRILFSSMCMFATLLGGYSYAQDSVNDDEIYQLDPFTISEEATEGYIASNSLAGTRTNTEIKDIPVNIQVFTKDFAEDFLITNQVELERYNAALLNVSG